MDTTSEYSTGCSCVSSHAHGLRRDSYPANSNILSRLFTVSITYYIGNHEVFHFTFFKALDYIYFLMSIALVSLLNIYLSAAGYISPVFFQGKIYNITSLMKILKYKYIFKTLHDLFSLIRACFLIYYFDLNCQS